MATSHPADGLCERDRSNLRRVRVWSLPFLVCFLVSVLMLGPDENRESLPLWQIALVLLPLIPGFFAFNAYFRFAQEADELIRHVMYEAAAKSFAVVVVLGFIYSLYTQVFGDWKDSGLILWVIGYLTYQFLFVSAWKKFDV